MDTSRFGDVAESFVIGELVKRGYNVSVPFGNCRYDLIAELSGRFKRIQVKYVGRCTENDTIPIILHSIGRKGRIKYTEIDIDHVVVYFEPNGKFYIVPAKDFNGKMVMHLRVGKSKNNQSKKITLASKYEGKWSFLDKNPAL